MKTLKQFFYVLAVVVLAVSCSKDEDPIFTGDVTVTLLNKGNTETVEGEATEFVYEVILSRSFDKEINLTFNLEDLQQFESLISIETKPVVIAKNSTKGMLKLVTTAKPDSENILTEIKTFPIVLDSYTGISNKIKLTNNELIKIKPEEGFVPLTEQQKELVAHYKANGIDIAPWIGKIPVEVEVKTAAGGSFAPFENPETKTYKGVTHITLSQNATKEKPLLVMVNNAFGVNDYLQWVFRHETILNTNFWYNPAKPDMPPAPLAVLTALGNDKVQKWKNKEYSFNVVVDDLEFKSDKTVEFVRENGAQSISSNFLTNSDDTDSISAVNFKYEFPLWDELLELAKNNTELLEKITQGGSVHPNKYIGYSPILSDDWGGGNWVAPTSSYDNTTKKMTFKFNTDHMNSADYDIITVTYTSPY